MPGHKKSKKMPMKKPGGMKRGGAVRSKSRSKSKK